MKLGKWSSALAFGIGLVMNVLQGAEGPVTITNQPKSLVVLQDSPATFSVGVDGTAPFAYQWRRNGSAIANATNSTYPLISVQPADDLAQFTVIVSNSLGKATSAVAVLRVDPGVAGTNVTSFTLIDMATQVWKYYASGDLGATWRAPSFDDSSWSSGTAMFGFETTPSEYPLAFNTPLAAPKDGGTITVYFRTHFTFNGSPDMTSLVASNLIDDGAVFYLNGQYAGQIRVATAPNQVFTDTSPTSTEGAYDVITLPTTNLLRGDNILEIELHDNAASSSDKVFGMALQAYLTNRVTDPAPPTIERILPPIGATLAELSEIEVLFSKPVMNVDASDLLINGVPATNLQVASSSQYVFEFTQPPTGVVQITWAPNHGICDLGVNANAIPSDGWSYVLDPKATPPILLNEFLANNKNGYPNAKKDIDGDYSDWLELYNSGADTVNLQGWFLTDDPTDLTKWTFPASAIGGNKYLLVWCSGKSNVVGQLHASFKLNAAGGYLALVNPSTNIVSQISSYPIQSAGVSYGLWPGTTTNYNFFTLPTPEAANNTSGGAAGTMAPPVNFSVAGGTYMANFNLVLSTTNPAAAIYYTTTTNMPTTNMTRYTGPISINNTLYLRARAFVPGMLPGEVHSEGYIKLDNGTVFAGFTNTAANFNSDLPVIVFHNYGGGAVPAGANKGGYSQFSMIQVFEPVNGRTYLTNAPTIASVGTIHRRGAATLDLPKNNLRVEFQGEYKEDRQVELLGMPADGDWVLYAINGYDKVLMHNPLAHELYRQMGHYTPRTRFVEVFVKKDSTVGPLLATDYQGLYVLEEKIKISKDRIDIDELTPLNTNAPTVTGGYLFSVDKTGVGAQFTAANQAFWWLNPEAGTVVSSQSSYLLSYLNSSFATFSATNGTNFANWIDVPAWIDNHIHNTMVNNADMFRISAYWIKRRNGLWAPACLWDFDRGFGMYAQDGDQRGFNPVIWHSNYGDKGTDPFNNDADGGYANPWFSLLFKNIDWFQLWIDRYQELRTTVYAQSNVTALINQYGAQVNEATKREYAKAAAAWSGSSSDTRPNAGTVTGDGFTYTFPSPGTWQGELEWVRTWFTNRLRFMDTNFLDRPSLNRPQGMVGAGATVTITPAAKAGSWVLYTLDGSDPRAMGGGISPNTYSNLGPFTLSISNNLRVCARSLNPTHRNMTGSNSPPLVSIWSGPVAATYVVSTPSLAVTEIMYHPASGGTNLEFIELKNTGATAINLRGYQFTNGIYYTFPTNAPVLQPGGYIVVASAVSAFTNYYRNVTNVVGNYSGSLKNNGERLTLVGPYREPILDFSFNNAWYPMTDGNGFSLVIVNENAAFNSWTNATSWRPSALEGGSPGAADPAPATIWPIYVNEVIANPAGLDVDQIELYNPNSFAVDIANWYLSDDFGAPKKFRIPSATAPNLIPAYGFKVFTANDFDNPPGATNTFGLGARGDNVYLFSANTNGLLTGYYHGFSFGVSPLGAAFGRVVTTTGKEEFVLQTSSTIGNSNSGPAISPIVITEIMYSPQPYLVGTNWVQNPDEEYIELYNASNQTVPLYDPAHYTNTWKLRDAIDYVFPQGLVMQPGTFLVVVNFDPQTNTNALNNFKARYNLTDDQPIYGPWTGQLNNAGDNVELVRPDEPVLPSGSAIYIVPEVMMDKVDYQNAPPWPCGTDGGGSSLQRLYATQFGNDPINWQADTPNPGKGTTIKPTGTPIISVQPADTALPAGSQLRLEVQVCSIGTVGYQWRFNGANLSGQTNQILVISNIQTNQSGYYSVVVTNAAGQAQSRDALVVAQYAPIIQTQPQSQTVLGYTTVDFSVAAGVTPPFTYQWYFNGTPLAGANSSTLRLTNVLKTLHEGSYSVSVANSAGQKISSNAFLTINMPSHITVQPASLIVVASNNATFTVTATGDGGLGYQWYFNGGAITGATASNYVISSAIATHAGNYQVVVSNAFGMETSTVAQLTVNYKPAFVIKPANQIVAIGESMQMSAAVTGTLPMQYAWKRGTVLVATNSNGDLSDTLTMSGLTMADAGNYVCYAYNAANPGGAMSLPPAYLIVVQPPVDRQVMVGSNTTLRVLVATTSTGNKYQWRSNSVDIPGATSTNLVLNNVQPSFAATYSLMVSNGAALRFFPMQLTVQTTATAPVIVQAPTNTSAAPGGEAYMNVLATGTDPLSYAWWQNGSNLVSWATNNWLVWTNVTATNYGNYVVVVSNAIGSVTSTVATLSALSAPEIVQDLNNVTTTAGQSVTLEVQVIGMAPLSYQWWRNETNLAGTEPALTLTNVQAADAGNYVVVISNALGMVTSAVAVVTVEAGLADSDGDGIPDDWERAHGLVVGTNDTLVDSDGDGLTNWQEYLAGTDPTNRASVLKLAQPVPVLGQGLTLEFQAISNRSYTVQYLDSLSSSNWQRLQDILAAPTNRQISLTNSMVIPTRYYRIATPILP